MTTFLFYLAVFTLLIILVTQARLLAGHLQMRSLEASPPAPLDQCPLISIIVAARNEERDIEPAVRSLLALDYPRYELLVVNDRSTDRTGEILARIAAEDARLHIATVSELPPGWLGKNHALHFGAERAQGEWLLFTDADVVFAPSALRRAMSYIRSHSVDHLSLLPGVRMPGVFLQAFATLFAIYFAAYFRPWAARDPNSSAYVGVGAFNLLRKDAYEEIGGMRAIAMRPDDDVKLGKLVKKNGFAQDCLSGTGLVEVPWYATAREVVGGLMKNAFAGVDYRVSVVVFSSLGALLCNVWPFIAIFCTSDWTWWLNLAAVVLLLTLALGVTRSLRVSPLAALLFPVAALFFIFIQYRAMFLTWWNDGIFWRDTHYSLAQLKANKV